MGTPIPLAMVALLLGIAVAWRAWVQRRTAGISGIMLFRTATPAAIARDLGIVALPPLLIWTGVVAWRAPFDLLWSGWIRPFGTPGALRAGIVICTCAVGFIVASQMAMGRSWRIGIDDGASPGLVTGGPFAFCRNPIFLGMMLWHAGFVLVIPTWGNAALWVAIVIGVHAQVRNEEAYLLRTYGDAYRAYAARTGRFLPGLGRL